MLGLGKTITILSHPIILVGSWQNHYYLTGSINPWCWVMPTIVLNEAIYKTMENCLLKIIWNYSSLYWSFLSSYKNYFRRRQAYYRAFIIIFPMLLSQLIDIITNTTSNNEVMRHSYNIIIVVVVVIHWVPYMMRLK